MKWEPATLAEWCAGRWLGSPGPITGVTQDTRKIETGHLYVALRGERTDGHLFVQEAAWRGASAAMVEASAVGKTVQPEGLALLVVDDTWAALSAMARGYRRTWTMPVIGITGSVGKTTTKEMTAAILSRLGPTVYTEGNLNNNVGLPLSMLKTDAQHRYGVFELGTNHPGELGCLASVLHPTLCAVTNVGRSHLEFFTGTDAVAREKAALPAALPRDGIAVLNADDAYFPILSQACSGRVLTTSLNADADYTARPGAGWNGWTLVERATREHIEVRLPLPGEHQARNALQAAALARQVGADWAAIAEGLSGLGQMAGRWEVVHAGGCDIVNDAYNANPESMQAAIGTFAQGGVETSWLVLGGMLELGAEQHFLHQDVGRFVARWPWAGIVVINAYGRWLEEGIRATRPDAKVVRCDLPDDVVRVLETRLTPGSRVLLKASHSFNLGRVAASLRDRLEAAGKAL